MSGCVRLNPECGTPSMREALAMGIFERYLSAWAGLCIRSGVVLDNAVFVVRSLVAILSRTPK